MKKVLSLVLAVALIALSATPAFAHGSKHSVRRVATKTTVAVSARAVSTGYSVCGIEDCTLTGQHRHGGASYIGHHYGDGHDYHAYCAVENCFITGYHEHDGAYCFGHSVNDGHDYHDYCYVADCLIKGYHGHDGSYHFGHTTNAGYKYHYSGGGHH